MVLPRDGTAGTGVTGAIGAAIPYPSTGRVTVGAPLPEEHIGTGVVSKAGGAHSCWVSPGVTGSKDLGALLPLFFWWL